jgi:hypothetical protein
VSWLIMKFWLMFFIMFKQPITGCYKPTEIWETNNVLANNGILAFHGIKMFITVFKDLLRHMNPVKLF